MRQGLTQLHGKWDGWNSDKVDYHICSSIPMVILWGWNYIYDNIVGMETVVCSYIVVNVPVIIIRIIRLSNSISNYQAHFLQLQVFVTASRHRQSTC